MSTRPPTVSPRARLASLAAGLVVLVALVYAPVRHHGFVDFDDGEYVTGNPHVLGGITPASVRWAFTTGYAANWHPLTWLSHMLDVELFGTAPGGHHLTSVALHGASAVVLFLLLRALTGAAGRSALVAALFAIHPLHVESVAWVAERKDVLSGLFFFLAISAHASFVRSGGAWRAARVALLFALGLLAKPMVVTLPFVLLLLDFWPLARPARPLPLLLEKTPLFALSIASALATMWAQGGGNAIAERAAVSLPDRVCNGALSYVLYLRDTAWPSSLAVFYPHAFTFGERVPRLPALLAGIALAGVTALVVRERRRRPYLLVGWLWYLGTLVPVIGLVQVGAQARADRYTYLPLVGIFVMVAWGLGDLAAFLRVRPATAALPALALVAVLAVAARAQVGTWRDRPTLYGHALDVTKRNWLAWNNLGRYHLDRGELDPAMSCFARAAELKPDFSLAWYNAGVVLLRQGSHGRAVAAYREALRLDPENADAWENLSLALRATGDERGAEASFARASELRGPAR